MAVDAQIHVEDADKLNVRDRTSRPGAIIHFGYGALVYLTPEKEAELLALLMARAPKLPRLIGAPLAPPPEPLRLLTDADFPLGFDVGFVTHNTCEADSQPNVVDFPATGDNFRRVASVQVPDPAA